jgi:hypothetical protein
MVQVSFDTNNDSLEELEHAKALLERAIQKRGSGTSTKEATAAAPPSSEETAIDTPFLKITVKSEERAEETGAEKEEAPTLNELLSEESITEDELHKMFKESSKFDESEPAKETVQEKKRPKEKAPEEDGKAYIEIIEYSEDEKKN